MKNFPDGLVAVVKRDCPTCALIEPVLQRLAAGAAAFVAYSQDDPAFPSGITQVIDDSGLEGSFHLNIDIVPTLIRIRDGREVARAFGWHRGEWESVSGVPHLGADLPESRPGCGSKTQDPGMPSRLAVRYGEARFGSRGITVPASVDPIEYCYERGWSDGLPVVPPTRERVLEMLQGTRRAASEVIGQIPTDLIECTVEKAAISAVMAGCKPEYFPVVLAAIEAVLVPEYGLHGVICTTNFVGPVIVVNGPIARAIGMNCKINALGQGNRANATIGRALQLLIRNFGGGRPGEIDRAVLGNPGKYTFCFAEDEDDPWDSLAVERGFPATASTVTLFSGEGVTPVMDEISRTPESLARSFAAVLRVIHHPKHTYTVSAVLVVTPEHAAVFHAAGWSKQRLKSELQGLLQIPVREMLRGHGGTEPGFPPDAIGRQGGTIPTYPGMPVGLPATLRPDDLIPKYPNGIDIVRAGGGAGKFSGIISGLGSITIQSITKEIVS